MTFIASAWEFFKIDDPKTFRDYYEDESIDRERKFQVTKTGKWNQLKTLWDWYPSHYSRYEKKFLLKVDLTVLVFVTLSFYTKYLDKSNVSNAYVSGMKQELNITGNQYNYFTTFFNIGYMIFQIPLVLLVQRQKTARYLLIVCELVWGLCTFGAAAAQNATDLYVTRFFTGMSEAVGYPAAFVILSTWYTPDELMRRAAFYNMTSNIGTATSGLLQTACRENLSGVLGLSGWRWQFIIDGLITLVCTLYGLFLFPGTPDTTKKFGILNEDDLVFARKRMQGKIALPRSIGKKVWKDLLTTWQPYLLIALWCAVCLIQYSSDMTLYIKSKVGHGFTASDPTYYAAAAGGVAALSALLFPNFCLLFGKLAVVSFLFGLQYYALAVLIIWNTSESLKLSAYFVENILMAIYPIFATWTMNLCRDSAEKKALTLALMNTLSAVTGAWLTPLQWNTKYCPRYFTAYRIALGFLVLTHLLFVATWILDKYDEKLLPKLVGDRRKYNVESESDESEGEEKEEGEEENKEKDKKGKSENVVRVREVDHDSV